MWTQYLLKLAIDVDIGWEMRRDAHLQTLSLVLRVVKRWPHVRHFEGRVLCC